MIGEPWLSAVLLAVAAVHLLALLYVVRLYHAGDGATDRRTTDGSTVECPSCDAENETAYRFCRRCVGELPGGFVGGKTGRTPRSRRML